MRTPTRASIYALIPPLVALAVGVGWLTTTQGAVVAALAVEAVTLGFACYYAVILKAPLARTVVYGFLAAAAAAAVVWGLVSAELAELVVAAVMAGVGIVLAESNTPAHGAAVRSRLARLTRKDTPMRLPTRASIYALVPPLVALLVGFGLVADAQGLVLAGLATEAITLAIACYHAAKLKTPLARTVVYGFLAAVSAAAVVWGLVDAVRAELIVAAVMAIAGVFLAESNTPSVEVGADGIRDDNPQRIAGA